MNELKERFVSILTLLVWSALSFGQRAWGDGAVAPAQFYNPEAVALDSAGNLFVADSHYHTLRKLTLEGTSTNSGVAGVPGNVDGSTSAAQLIDERARDARPGIDRYNGSGWALRQSRLQMVTLGHHF